jgi:HK97 family phage prohead protease
MPYFITDKSPDCSGWATIKEDGEVIGCHTTKQDAIDQMVAVSLAEDMEPGGERNSDANEVVIVDVDGTLIAGGRGIQKNVDYVNNLYDDYDIYIVTGRPESDEEKTLKELADAGVQFDDIEFNDDLSIPTATYKKTKAREILNEKPVKLAIDNDAAARRAYSDLGIPTMDPKTIKSSDASIRQISLEIPAYIRSAARKGLDYYGQGLAGEGLVDRTVREARDMARGDITEDKVVRANAWAQRHAVDLQAPKNSDATNDQFPGAGAVAHYLWGINPLNPQPARDWFARKSDAIQAERGLFTFYRKKDEYFANIPTMESMPVETRRIHINDFELREGPTGDGMSFTGYAAVFNSDSEPLPFIERIMPGAFKKSLKGRNTIKMYMNHDSSMLLASTRSKTLRLEEDSKGLLVNADLPDTTVGRDLSVLMKRGDVDSMSFGFSVPTGGDKWSDDGMTRELRQVRLHEVSVVTGFPAYKATSASVRSVDVLAERTGVDADKLAEAITMLESGNTLTDESADLLSSAVSKLRAEPTKVPASVGLLAKKLELLKNF